MNAEIKPIPTLPHSVTITDIRMPFDRMVWFLLKISFALLIAAGLAALVGIILARTFVALVTGT